MASGHPDWGQAQQNSLIASVSDLGELAARLGSLVTYSRTGNVLWLSDFADGLIGFDTSVQGAGSAVSADTSTAFRGGACVKLLTDTGASDFAQVRKPLTLPRAGQVGFEIGVAMASSRGAFDVEMIVLAGGSQYNFAVRLSKEDQTLSYLNSGGTFTVFETAQLVPITSTLFHVLKLVVDPDTQKYARFIMDQETFDLTGIAGQLVGASSFEQVTIKADLNAEGGLACTAYVDCPIFTINEP